MTKTVRCGQLTIFYDPEKLALGGKAKLRIHHSNGETTDVELLAFDLFGALLKFSGEVSRILDVLQREMEKVQA